MGLAILWAFRAGNRQEPKHIFFAKNKEMADFDRKPTKSVQNAASPASTNKQQASAVVTVPDQ